MMILPILFAQPSSDSDTKVNLDAEQLQDELPKAVQKVELDLDDALFLDDQENSQESQEESTASSITTEINLAETDLSAVPFWKKIWFWGSSISIILIIILGIFFFTHKPQSPSLPMATKDLGPKIIKANESFPEQRMTLKPFLIPIKENQNIDFFNYVLAIPYSSTILHQELEEKLIPIREAVYQYLITEQVVQHDLPGYAEILKQEILPIVNNLLENGPISSLYIVEYGVQ